MHEISRRESFKSGIGEIEQYLKSKFGDTLKSLSNRELKVYGPGHTFVRGWVFTDLATNVAYRVLIPAQFPYATPRVAIVDAADAQRDFGKKLPHVEGYGLLCLPAIEPSRTDAVAVLNKMLCDAFKFLDEFFNNHARAKAEFQREFISYWNRQNNGADLLSLVDVTGGTRKIFFAQGYGRYWVTADSVDDLNRWHRNRHHTAKLPGICDGLFINLEEAPVPPFPETPDEFDVFVEKYAPQALETFRARRLHPGPFLIVMSASVESGVGLMGISFFRNERGRDPIHGYRGTMNMPMDVRKKRFNASYDLRRHEITRVDHDWVHGRDADETQKDLKKASVVILGCGALGSHVAVRLAQAGVGSLLLIDPEILVPANIGRHALGMTYVSKPKATSLTREIRQRFPHVSTFAYVGKWEDSLAEHKDEFESADLIVSAMGSWGSEGSLNEWQLSLSEAPPILYGWTEPRAAASHAVLIQDSGTCLQCVLDESGRMRDPETEGWSNEDGILSEPACGAVFQPFGPLELAYAEALVGELAIEALTGGRKQNCHTVHATAEDRVIELGGKWTSTHQKSRPKSFVSSFQYERPLLKHPQCPHCSK